MSAAESLDNPILNSPYEPPAEHFVLGPAGPTGEVRVGRRPSESFIVVPPARRRRGGARPEPEVEQHALDFDVTGERREINSLINDVRNRVDRWRAFGYPGVTPVSRKLLQHWADASRGPGAVLPAGSGGDGHLPGRGGLKMATGKTIVMAMLIAWQTAKKAFIPRDARFTNRFLVVTPGITIRDRLRVLLPADTANYYRERDLVPPDLWPTLADASIYITNLHTFLKRDAKEIRGVAGNTRKLLNAGKRVDPFKETPDQMVERVLRDGRGKGEIVVFNREGMSREEIDAAIRRHAEFEELVDKPYVEERKVRVTGPFTVKSLSPHRSLGFVPTTEPAAEREAAARPRRPHLRADHPR